MKNYRSIFIVCLLVLLSVYSYGAEAGDLADVAGNYNTRIAVEKLNIEVKAKGNFQSSIYGIRRCFQGKYKRCLISQSQSDGLHEITLDIGDTIFIGKTKSIFKLASVRSLQNQFAEDEFTVDLWGNFYPPCMIKLYFSISPIYAGPATGIFNGKNSIEYIHKVIDTNFTGTVFYIDPLTGLDITHASSHKRSLSL